MTADEIRAAIAADPALQALVPDSQAIADALSVGRTRWKHTDIGVGTIIEVLGLAAANPVLDALIARAKEADPVDEYAVRAAIYNDDGSLRV